MNKVLDGLISKLDAKRREVSPKDYPTTAYIMAMTDLALVIGYLKKLRALLSEDLR